MPHSKSSNDTPVPSLDSSPIVQVAAFWNWLPAFRAVAESRHLPTASQRLGVSASALSRSVRLLENSLGVELFRREGPRLELTDAGETFCVAVRNGMRGIHDGMLAARSETLRGVLRISSSGAVTTIAVVPALLDLRAEHPELQGVVLNEPAESEASMLTTGRLDLVVRQSPLRAEGLDTVSVGKLTHGIYCAPGHPLHESGPLGSATDLAGYEFVSPGTDAQGRCLDGWPESIERKIGIQVDQLRIGAEVCAAGRMLAVLPDALAERLALPLRRLEVEAVPSATVYAISRAHLGSPSRVAVLVEAIRTRLDGLSPPGNRAS